jgi:hypothetical protein
MVRTSERLLAPQRHLPDAMVVVACQAGAFGKATSDWPLPQELQGKKIWVDVMAKRKYRSGRGKLLRFRSGLMVGSVPNSVTSDTLNLLGTLGGVSRGRAARTEILLPSGVASSINFGQAGECQTLWKFGDPMPEKT